VSRRNAASAGARAMARARWAKTSTAERKAILADVRSHGAGRKRSPDRCYCGERTWHSGTLRGFDCCKRAGKFPQGEQMNVDA
jgi:hypothetical protein